MIDRHSDHTASLLGRSVLIVDKDSAELWTGGGWIAVPPLHRHYGHTATLLEDGRVLVVGPQAEIFDPKSRTWRSVLATEARVHHSAVRMRDGRVIIAGGTMDSGSPLLSVEMFDPESSSWTRLADLPRPRITAVALADRYGRILMLGGRGTTELDVLENGRWRDAGAFAELDRSRFVAAIHGNRIRVVGGTRGSRAKEFIDAPTVEIDLPRLLPLEPEPIETEDPDPEPVSRKRATVVRRPKSVGPAILYKDAYKLLAAGRLGDGKDMLIDCVDLYPKAADCHRSLASIYATLDDTRLSILHYRRYLALRPNASDASRVRKMIRDVEGDTEP